MKRFAFIPCAIAALLSGSALAEDSLGGILDRVYIPKESSSDRVRLAPPAKPTVHQVMEGDILARLEQELSQQFHVDGELRLSFGRPWQPIRVASDDWQVSIPELPIGGLSKNFLVRVKINAGDRVWFDQQVVVQAQLFKPVLVATRRLERGQPLDSTAADIQTQDVLRERVSLVAANARIEDLEVVQTVFEGRPLTSKDVVTAPLVRKGAMVEVTAGDGRMSITMKGLAMSTGGAGDAVTVRNMDTRKDFQARVVNRNAVRVTF